MRGLPMHDRLKTMTGMVACSLPANVPVTRLLSSLAAQPWFQKEGGLHFACTQCGKCCTGGPDRTVSVTQREVGDIAAMLDQDPQDFVAKFCRAPAGDSDGSRHKLKMNPRTEACIFLVEKKCSIYQHRPLQCRTYPFWPEIVQSAHDWEAEAAQRCEGIQLQPPHAESASDQANSSEAATGHSSQPQQVQDLADKSARQEARHLPQGQSTTGDAGQASWAESQVLPEVVKRGLVLEEIRRSGEMHGSSAGELMELLTEVSPELVEEVAGEFFATNTRTVLHESSRVRVLESHLGSPPVQSRALVHRAAPGYAQTIMQLEQQADGSMALDHSSLVMPAHQAMCLALVLQAMAQKRMQHKQLPPGSHSDAIVQLGLQRPLSVHDLGTRKVSLELNVAVIGAGACALPMALRHHLPKATVDAVEMDPETLDMAACFFGAQQDTHLSLLREDGLSFLTHPGSRRMYDVIFLDAAIPGQEPGSLEVPPPAFLEAAYVQEGLQRRLRHGGVLAVNLLGGHAALSSTAQQLSPYFHQIMGLHLQEATVLFACVGPGDADGNSRSHQLPPPRIPLFRLTAAAQERELRPLQRLCGALLPEVLEPLGLDEQFHDTMKANTGYGWYTAREFLDTR